LSQLVLAWHLGRRSTWDANDFVEKLSRAHGGELQLSTDGFNACPNTVDMPRHAGGLCPDGQGIRSGGRRGGSPVRSGRLSSEEKINVSGSRMRAGSAPAMSSAPTGSFEATWRRFTRLSNGFSRKKTNLRAVLALYFACYNFWRMHKSIHIHPP